MSHVRPLLLAVVGQSHMEFPKFTHLATCHSLSARELPVSAVTLGEGNGNPLQYSCLENPSDRGA